MQLGLPSASLTKFPWRLKSWKRKVLSVWPSNFSSLKVFNLSSRNFVWKNSVILQELRVEKKQITFSNISKKHKYLLSRVAGRSENLGVLVSFVGIICPRLEKGWLICQKLGGGAAAPLPLQFLRPCYLDDYTINKGDEICQLCQI